MATHTAKPTVSSCSGTGFSTTMIAAAMRFSRPARSSAFSTPPVARNDRVCRVRRAAPARPARRARCPRRRRGRWRGPPRRGARKGRPRSPGTATSSKPVALGAHAARGTPRASARPRSGTTKRTGAGTCASSAAASVASTPFSTERRMRHEPRLGLLGSGAAPCSLSRRARAPVSRSAITRAARSSFARSSSVAPGSSSAGENATTPALRSGTVAAQPSATVAPNAVAGEATWRSGPHSALTVPSTAATWSASV